MMMYYFGNSLQYIQAGYASSNRSSCKACKVKINKDELRLGLILDDDHFNAKYWYHLKCFTLKPRHLQLQPDKIQEKVYNIDHLEEVDFEAVVQHLKQQLDRVKNKKKPAKKQSKKESKKQSKKDTKKKTKKPSKKKKEEQSDSDSQSSYESESESSYDQKSQDSNEKKKEKATKSKAKSQPKNKPVKCKGYTDTQSQQFEKLYQKFQAMTATELKQLLSKNNQSKNGNKSELAEKCADGKILGQIPKCHSCGGGRLRFDKQTGIYTCPGYMEDTDFIHCNKKYELSEVSRTQWVD